MSEKYSRIFSLSENLYVEGSPIVIKAGALLRDNDTNQLIAQLKLQNISNKAIKLVKVEITCFDSMDRPLGGAILYEYLDLHITRGVDFGTQKAIRVPNTSARSYSVRVVEVGFADNTVWNGSNKIWKAAAKQQSINRTILDKEVLEGYKNAFGNNATFSVCEHEDLWFCTCGAINHSSESQCYKCNAKLANLKNLDFDALKSKGIHIGKEKNKKAKKITIGIIIALATIAALVIGLFIGNSNYKNKIREDLVGQAIWIHEGSEAYNNFTSHDVKRIVFIDDYRVSIQDGYYYTGLQYPNEDFPTRENPDYRRGESYTYKLSGWYSNVTITIEGSRYELEIYKSNGKHYAFLK